MKLFWILCVFFVMLTSIGCVKKEENTQTPLSNAVDAISENNNRSVLSSISITLIKEEWVENMVESYLSSLRHHEAIFGTLDTQELMESIARFLE